jgi:general secretion pathway protein G
MPRFLGRTEEARRTKAIVQIRNIESALKLFKLDNGFYPTTEQGLEALVINPTVGEIPKHWKEGGYMEKGKVPLDPWGNPFQYLSPGINDPDYDLFSLGADGEIGGEDRNADINSWEIE